MTASVIVTIIIVALLLVCLIRGFLRGFLRMLLTTMALVVTLVLAGLLAPKITTWVSTTFIGTGIEKSVSSFVDKNVDARINAQAQSVQDQVIDKLPLPTVLRDDFSEKNTASDYINYNVTRFTDYLKTRLSGVAISAVTYLLLLIVIYLVIRIILRIARLISRIPIIGGFNRLLGAILGLAEGLLIVWCAGLIIMALSGTSFGIQAAEVINSNAFLKFLYDNNGIIIGVSALFRSFA